MKRIALYKFGGPEQLRLEDAPTPQAGDGDVVIRTLAIGVCYRDTIDRVGGYPHLRLPIVPGHEAAGEVVEVGRDVRSVRPGDRVLTMSKVSCASCEHCTRGNEQLCRLGESYGQDCDGAYAEYIRVHERALCLIPKEMDYATAAVLACTVAAPLHALRRAAIAPGDSVLITGASGGLGIHAVQLAKLFAASVIAVTSSSHKVEAIRRYGADAVIVAADGQFASEVKSATGGRGVDACLEIAGAPTLGESLRCMAPRGRVVIIGNVEQQQAAINPGVVILRELEIRGAMIYTRAEVLDAIELVSAGKLKAVIGGSFPLAEAPDVHERLGNRELVGRAVLIP
jgi:acryloyl-coenzyme A reductase